ncbi:MAG TPA: hypothetical protein DCQ87_01875, partial [Lachnospiraceae bacterium]|nr:hypothetical protein [Lachnospiraceae bacterium]
GSDYLRVKDLRIYDHLKYLIPGDFSLKTETLEDEIENSLILPTIDKLYKGNVSVRVYLHQSGEKNPNQVKRFSG